MTNVSFIVFFLKFFIYFKNKIIKTIRNRLIKHKDAHITNSLAQQELREYDPNDSKCFLKVLRKILIAQNGIQKVRDVLKLTQVFVFAVYFKKISHKLGKENVSRNRHNYNQKPSECSGHYCQ